MASFAQNNSAQIDSNLDQEFASYVRQKAPSQADELLSNTSDIRVAKERDALAQSFVKERLLPKLENEYSQNRENIEVKGAATSGGNLPSSSDLIAEHESNDKRIKVMSEGAEIKHDTAQNVLSKETSTKENIANIKDKIVEGKNEVEKQQKALENNHQNELKNHTEKMEQEKSHKIKSGLIYDNNPSLDKSKPNNGVMNKDEYDKYPNSD